MSDIAPIGRPTAAGPSTSGRITPSSSAITGPTRAADRVELSHAAQLLSKLAELPDIRQGLVDRVKSEIAQGTYETEDKVDRAIDSLGEDLA